MASSPTISSKTRDSLKAVRQDLGSIVSRLEAADKAANKSLEALDTALRALAKQGQHETDTSQAREAQLQKQINALKSHVTSTVRETQKAVNSDLKTVLSDPRLSTLAEAIDSADARLRKTEAEQAQSLTTLRRYVADLAREVEVNLNTEREAREAALQAAEQKQASLQNDIATCLEKMDTQSQALAETHKHIKSVETDTATALQSISEKIVHFAEQASDARAEQSRTISGKISDIALETQKNFEDYKDGVDRNIEALQQAQNTAQRDLTQDLDALRTRLETLEYGLSAAPVQPAASLAAATAGAAPIEDAFTPAETVETIHAPEHVDMMEADAAPAQSEGLAPSPYIPEVDTQTFDQAAPLTPANAYGLDTGQAADIYAPITPDNPYNIAAQQPIPQTPETVETFQASPYAQLAPPQDPYSNMANDPAVPAQGYDDMPYANPAYAEEYDPTMDQARIGGPIDMESQGATRSKLFTPSNLRAAVLGLAVLGVGYVAFNNFTGKATTDKDTPEVFAESSPTSLVANNVANTVPTSPTVQTLEPIGNYAEDVNLSTESIEGTYASLATAADTGNMTAQYQLGLIKLQNGETKEALELLRKSANQGQPAAQYRLAKLYESGNGVTKDLKTARDLIERSAQNGNRIAMHDLANFYANGVGGLEQDLALSARWFEKAAERGVVDSQYNIGYLYEHGYGVVKNTVEAYVWYGVAAAQGDTEATRRITALDETLSLVEIESAKARISGFKPVKIDKTANGIFEDQPWQAPSQNSDGSTQIAQVQSLLNNLGYSVGTADGQVGSRTRTAIIAFERANGLPETGRINSALVEQLELASGV